MKLFEKLGLSASEIKLVTKVIVFSTVITIASVAGFRVYHLFTSKSKFKPIDLLENVTTVTPLDIEANLDDAKRYIQGGNYEQAIPHLQRVIQLKKNDYTAHSLLADVYLEYGDYGNALTEYNFLSQKTLPDSLASRICTRRSITQFYMEERNASVDALQNCIQLYPKNPESYCFLGQIKATQEIPSQEALNYLNKAISLDSNYVEAWYQLARYYMELQQYTKARELLLRALEINPLHGKSQSRLGMVYYYLHDYELSKAAYQTALALNPGDFNTRYNLGETYYAQGDTTHAIKAFKQALENNPGHVEANFKLGIILLANNMVKEAINHLEQASHNSKNDTRILLQLAVAYEKISDKEKALSIYKRIHELDALNVIAQEKIKFLTE